MTKSKKSKTNTKKKATTKKTNTKLAKTQSKETLQPGARGGIIGPSNFPGYNNR